MSSITNKLQESQSGALGCTINLSELVNCQTCSRLKRLRASIRLTEKYFMLSALQN